MAQNPSTTAAKDILERTVWTLLQGASATAIVAWYQSLDYPDIPVGFVIPTVGLIAAGLAAIKGKLATRFGNGGASLGLSAENAPVPADKVLALEAPTSGIAVSGPATDGIPAGTPVAVEPAEHNEDHGLGELPDDVIEVPEQTEMPEGFDDGRDPSRATDPPEGTYPPEHAR